MTITTYTIRAASADAIHAALVAASAGKERPYAWGADRFDEARVRRPYAEMAAGASDPETGEPTFIPTGLWLAEVVLVDQADAELAAIAV